MTVVTVSVRQIDMYIFCTSLYIFRTVISVRIYGIFPEFATEVKLSHDADVFHVTRNRN